MIVKMETLIKETYYPDKLLWMQDKWTWMQDKWTF